MLKVGIWGFGGIATIHRRAYATLEEKGVPVKLVALCDIREEAFTKEVKINISDPNAKPLPKIDKCYTDIDEMMEKEDLDLIDICLPAYLHADAAIKALEKGYNVMSEKPMALNYADCERMIEAAAKAKGKLMIGQCLRFQNRYKYLKEAVETGKYGKVVSAAFSRLSASPLWSWDNWYMDVNRSGGARLDLHVHDIDMINNVFGMPARVSCVANGKEGLSGVDSVFTTMQYDNGTVINAIGDWSYPVKFAFDFQFRVSFEKGTLVLDNDKGLYFYDENEVTEIDCPLNAHAIANELEYFVDIIENNKENTVNPIQSTANTIKLQDAMKESMLNGGKIVEL